MGAEWARRLGASRICGKRGAIPVAQQLDEQTHPDASSAARLVSALRSRRPRGARDVEVHPGRVADERGEERRRGRRTRIAAAAVLDVGDLALDLALVAV